MRAKHLKAGIDANRQQYTVDVGWRSVVAERRPRRISDAQLAALLPNNNAVEDLPRGDMTGAATKIATALSLDPDSEMIWSNAGVIELRSGRQIGRDNVRTPVPNAQLVCRLMYE